MTHCSWLIILLLLYGGSTRTEICGGSSSGCRQNLQNAGCGCRQNRHTCPSNRAKECSCRSSSHTMDEYAARERCSDECSRGSYMPNCGCHDSCD